MNNILILSSLSKTGNSMIFVKNHSENFSHGTTKPIFAIVGSHKCRAIFRGTIVFEQIIAMCPDNLSPDLGASFRGFLYVPLCLPPKSYDLPPNPLRSLVLKTRKRGGQGEFLVRE